MYNLAFGYCNQYTIKQKSDQIKTLHVILILKKYYFKILVLSYCLFKLISRIAIYYQKIKGHIFIAKFPSKNRIYVEKATFIRWY